MGYHPSLAAINSISCVIKRGGGSPQRTNAALIFSDSVPVLVVDWRPSPEGDCPDVWVILDPRYLRKTVEGNYRYELEIVVDIGPLR